MCVCVYVWVVELKFFFSYFDIMVFQGEAINSAIGGPVSPVPDGRGGFVLCSSLHCIRRWFRGITETETDNCSDCIDRTSTSTD